MQHVIIPLHDNIDPALERWLARSGELVDACLDEMHDGEPHDGAIDSFFVHIAAEHLWQHTRGEPCWGALDVDAWLGVLATSPTWNDAWRAHAVGAITAFYLYLVRHGHLRAELALRVLRALEPHFNRHSRRLGFRERFCAEESVRRAAAPCVALNVSRAGVA